MSDYRMDIRGNIGLTDYSNIHDYLGIIDKDDKFTVIIDKQNTKDVNILNSILKENNLSVSEEGYDAAGNYHISASRCK